MKSSPLLLLAGFLPAVTLAALEPEPAPVMAGDFEVVPTLSVGLANDDNFYTEPRGEDATSIFVLTPAVQVRRGSEEEYVALSASLSSGTVTDNNDDNFLDLGAGMSGRFMPAGNLAVEAGLDYSQGHETRGSGNSKDCFVGFVPVVGTPCAPEPDVFQDVVGSLSGTLGGGDSRGRLTLALEQTARRYTSNGVFTAPLEYDLTALDVEFGWRVGGRTDAVLELRRKDYDYLAGGNLADSVGTEYLAGVEWEVTDITTGYAKVGVSEKDFDNAARADLDNPAWEVGVDWSPTEMDSVNAEFSSRIDETGVIGATAEEVSEFSLRYSRLVSERVEPYVRAWKQAIDYQGINRSDDLTSIGIGVDYKFRRWAVLGFSWGTTEQDSDLPLGLNDYESTVFALTANLTL